MSAVRLRGHVQGVRRVADGQPAVPPPGPSRQVQGDLAPAHVGAGLLRPPLRHADRVLGLRPSQVSQKPYFVKHGCSFHKI